MVPLLAAVWPQHSLARHLHGNRGCQMCGCRHGVPVSRLRMFLFLDLDISGRRDPMSPVPGFRSVVVVKWMTRKVMSGFPSVIQSLLYARAPGCFVWEAALVVFCKQCCQIHLRRFFPRDHGNRSPIGFLAQSRASLDHFSVHLSF